MNLNIKLKKTVSVALNEMMMKINICLSHDIGLLPLLVEPKRHHFIIIMNHDILKTVV